MEPTIYRTRGEHDTPKLFAILQKFVSVDVGQQSHTPIPHEAKQEDFSTVNYIHF
jgi:hypothetical protein